MEIRNVTTFLRVMELQNFSQAALQLGYSQSAVTVQIKQLEDELGVQLFERIGRRVKPTEQGKQFAVYAADIMKNVETAKNAMSKSEEPTGTLRIGVVESLSTSILPEVLMEFHRRCPQVQTTLKTGLNPELAEMVQKNDVDIIYFLDKRIYRSEWVKVMERPEPVYFVASGEHPFAKRRNVPLKEILAEVLIWTEKGLSYSYELEQDLASRGYEIRPAIEIGNTDLIVRMLLKNVGVSFLPHYVVKKYVEAGKLAVVRNDSVDIEIWSQLAYHKNKWLTPPLQIFIDIMQKAACRR